MARRLAAIAALVAIVALALTLLWRVYGHHMQNGTFEDESTLVQLRRSAPEAQNLRLSRPKSLKSIDGHIWHA